MYIPIWIIIVIVAVAAYLYDKEQDKKAGPDDDWEYGPPEKSDKEKDKK